MRTKVLIFIAIFISSVFTSIGLTTITAEPSEDYVILFDESHGQYFNRTLMNTALNLIEKNFNVNLLYQNNTEFNSTNLQGVDLLIIGNPGQYNQFNMSNEEIEAILDYFELGGSLFLLNNPLARDENVTGHVISFNDLLSARTNRLTSARFRRSIENQKTKATVIMDDFGNAYNNESFVSIENYNVSNEFIETNKLLEQTKTVENLTLYSNSISLGNEDKKYAIGRTELSSYSLGADGSIFQDILSGYLTWLLAKEIGDSRLIASGSTIMFSDFLIHENQKFINEKQNKELWLNLINWLLKVTPYEDRGPIAMPFYSLVLLSLGIAIISFIIAFSIYKYRQIRKKSVSIKI